MLYEKNTIMSIYVFFVKESHGFGTPVPTIKKIAKTSTLDLEDLVAI